METNRPVMTELLRHHSSELSYKCLAFPSFKRFSNPHFNTSTFVEVSLFSSPHIVHRTIKFQYGF